jgi:hypothetical protein
MTTPLNFNIDPSEHLSPEALAIKKEMDRLTSVVAHNLRSYYNQLTEEQFQKCVEQAILSQDFLRVCGPNGNGGFVYEPYRLREKSNARILELADQVRELTEPRPIETAPTAEGSDDILAWAPPWREWMVIGYWPKWNKWRNAGGVEVHPTLWLPLPKKPATPNS